MEVAATPDSSRHLSPDHQLLHDCLSLGALTASRPTARERLEATLGPELVRRLLTGLTTRSRR